MITDFELGEDGDIIELKCFVTIENYQNIIFSVDEEAREIFLDLSSQTITLQTQDDVSAVTLQSLVDSGQAAGGHK